MRLVVAALVAETLDLITLDPTSEMNPVGQHWIGPLLKAALIGALYIGWRVRVPYWPAVLTVALAAGIIGTWSNLL